MGNVGIALQTGNAHLAADDVRVDYETPGQVSVYEEWYPGTYPWTTSTSQAAAVDRNRSSQGGATVSEGKPA